MAGLTSPTSLTQSRKKSIVVVTDPPKMDLETYLQNYRGRTRYDRLIHIATTSTFLGLEAIKAAVIDAKKGRDVKRYLDAVSHLQQVAPNEEEAVQDHTWVNQMEHANTAEGVRLEAQLKGYKNNLIKESIRMGNEDLGKHFQSIGNQLAAFEAFSRMRQDVSLSKHIVDTSKHLIEIAVEQKNWIAVSSNVQKIKSVINTSDGDEKTIQPYLAAADGLAHMDSDDYYAAALIFLSTDTGMATSANTIMSPNDIATYGGLCALATMNRNEMQSRVLENSSFRTYLELEPHIRRAITFFVNSRYSACLSILESYRTDYLLDLHLHRHIDALYHLVRSKSIVQYFIPFSCVTLDSLNEQFAAPGKTIEKELVQMVQRGELEARIDTQNRLLTSLPPTTRTTLHAEALSTAHDYEKEARRRVLHMNIIANDLEVKGGPKKGAGLGGQIMPGMGPMDDFYDFSNSASGVASAAGLLGRGAGGRGSFQG